MRRPRRTSANRMLTAAFACATLLATAAPAAQAGCVGEDCPYTGGRTVGESGGGVLRFPQAIAIGPGGNVYVGDQNSHLVQVFTKDGQFVRQFGSPGNRPGELTAVSGIAVAPNGTVGLTDGGTNRVNLFADDGSLYGALGGSGTDTGKFRFGAGGGNDMPAGGSIAFQGGHFYISDSGNDRIQRMDLDGTNMTELVAPGRLKHPRGIALRGEQMLVAESQGHRLSAFRTDGKFLKTVGQGDGVGGSGGQLRNPFGVSLDLAGRTYVADDMNQRIVRFTAAPNYNYKARWGSYGTAPGQLAYPRALANDPERNLYVTNTGNDRIDVFSGDGRLLRSFGRSGRSPGQFNGPGGVAVDASGVRAVADTINGRVQLLNPDGTVASIWGSPNPGPTILPRPVDVAFDSDGNGFVLDQRRSRVIVFNRSTATVARTIGSEGSGPGQMLDPSAIFIDATGNLWITDTGNMRVVRFAPGGEYLGSFKTEDAPRGITMSPDGTNVYVTTSRHRVAIYSQDGRPQGRFGFGPGNKLSQFNAPSFITADATGDLWINDRGNNRIVHATAAGKRLGAFGSRGSGADGFVHPSGVALSCDNKIVIADTGNNVVDELDLASTGRAPACGQLPAPAPPPQLKYPTLPIPDGPMISARPLRKAGLMRGLPVRVGCDSACKVTATATLVQRGLPPKRKRQKARDRKPVSIMLKSKAVDLTAGQTKIMRFMPASKRDIAKLRKALAGKKGVEASVTLTAAGQVGEPTSQIVQVRGSA